ncbi:MAG: Clp protease N-terminal domain-containing protein [Candidatus Obscuribacterales bacterium]
MTHVFTNFSHGALAVMISAIGCARDHGHGQLDTDHILWGLTRTSCVIQQSLIDLGVYPQKVANRIVTLKGISESRILYDIPMSVQAKTALKLALLLQNEHGHEQLQSGHLLVGLLRTDDSSAVKIIRDLGLNVELLCRAAVNVTTTAILEGNIEVDDRYAPTSRDDKVASLVELASGNRTWKTDLAGYLKATGIKEEEIEVRLKAI